MPLNVCVLTEAGPFSWTHHYVNAFRQRCNVFTIGPVPPEIFYDALHLEHLKPLVQPHDVTTELQTITDLKSLLPADFIPDLVVCVMSCIVQQAFYATTKLDCPSVFISIDTWQNFKDYAAAINYDFVFVAQREFVPYLRATGSVCPEWLPLACAPEVHHPLPTPPTHDISYVGSSSSPVHGERMRLLSQLGKHFRVHQQSSVYGDEYCRSLSAGKIIFNHSAVREVNMRIFEAMAVGRMLLTNREADRNGLLTLFTDGVELVTYTDEEDLLEKAAYYLAHDEERERIAAAGCAAVLQHHTYAHRIDRILEVVGPACARQKAFRESTVTPSPLLQLLPANPGRVADLGMSGLLSKYAVKKWGGESFFGVSFDECTPRNMRYDQVVCWPGEAQSADTVLLYDCDTTVHSLPTQISASWKLLDACGTLILLMSRGTLAENNLAPAQLNMWMLKLNFYLIYAGVTGDDRFLLHARKRTRRIYDIYAEIKQHYPMEHTMVEACFAEDEQLRQF